ncbi:MAG TPA: putative dsRNA-binding protein, partial [Jatrophihabitans sp.]
GVTYGVRLGRNKKEAEQAAAEAAWRALSPETPAGQPVPDAEPAASTEPVPGTEPDPGTDAARHPEPVPGTEPARHSDIPAAG